jgi:hypothetical protein
MPTGQFFSWPERKEVETQGQNAGKQGTLRGEAFRDGGARKSLGSPDKSPEYGHLIGKKGGLVRKIELRRDKIGTKESSGNRELEGRSTQENEMQKSEAMEDVCLLADFIRSQRKLKPSDASQKEKEC